MFSKNILFFVLVSLLGIGCRGEKESRVILRLGHQTNENDVWHLSSLYFAQQVDSLTKGSVEIQVFAAEQLGKELDMIRSIEAGIVDMTVTGESMQVWADITSFCGMPYLIRDFDHLEKVILGTPGKKIENAMLKKIGLRKISAFARGPRHLTTNRPIQRPEDLNGIILRVPTVPLSVKTWEALGAKPTPMTLSEVFTGLQQGTVEAQENPLAIIYTAGFYEVQQYVNLTGHVVGWVYLVLGERQFQSLTPEQREALLLAGEKTRIHHNTLFYAEENNLRKKLEEKGMTFVDVDLDAFRKKAQVAVMENLPENLKQVYLEIQNIP